MQRFAYDEIGSTSTEAQRLAQRFPDEPILVVARTQTRGRGRAGNFWRSPPGGLWFSVAWPCEGNPSRMDAAPLVVGLAIAEAIQPVVGAGHALRLKWPNDLLFDGRKIAGILCERTLGTGAAAVDRWSLIVGVGINANVPPEPLATGLGFPASSLLVACGKPCELGRLLDECATRVSAALEQLSRGGFTEDDRGRVVARLAWLDQPVSLSLWEQHVEGHLAGVDGGGRLLLNTETGVRAFASGEVRSARAVTASHPLCQRRSLDGLVGSKRNPHPDGTNTAGPRGLQGSPIVS